MLLPVSLEGEAHRTSPPFDDAKIKDLNQAIIQRFSQEQSHGLLYSVKMTDVLLMPVMSDGRDLMLLL